MTVKDILFGSQKASAAVSNGGDPYWDSVTLLARAELSASVGAVFVNNMVGVYEYSDFNTLFSSGVSTNTQNTSPAKFGSTAIVNSSTTAAGQVHSIGPSANLAVGTGNFTLEFWVYFSTGNSVTQSFLTFANSSTSISLRRDGVTFALNTGGTLAGGVWHHIALVRSSPTSCTVYINGVNSGGFTAPTSAFNSTSYIVLGSQYPSFVSDGERLRGAIEEVRLTKGIARYTANFTPPTTAFPIWKDYSPKPLTGITFSTYRNPGTTAGVTVTAGTWDSSPTLTYQWQKYTGETSASTSYWSDLAGETSLNLILAYGVGAYRLKETATSGALVSKQYSPQLLVYSTG